MSPTVDTKLEEVMENAPVISMTFQSPYPGTDARTWERYLQWSYESWAPMTIKNQWPIGLDLYRIVREQPEYPVSGWLAQYKNVKEWQAANSDYVAEGIKGDIVSWTDRKLAEFIWSAVYARVKSYRSQPDIHENRKDTISENAPIIHLEAYRLSPEEQEKYSVWFNEYGSPIFLPLFMKQPGLTGYDWYEDTGFRMFIARELDYPKYLSIINFENLNAFENFLKSPELAGFQRAMRSVFPRGLKYEWHVQYQNVKSLRK